MCDARIRDEVLTKQVEHWLFALLRFALTLDETDRTALMARAGEFDRAGSRFEGPGFSFFTCASAEFCGAILAPVDPASCVTLRCFLNRIDNTRLRVTFEAAIGSVQRSSTQGQKSRSRDNLWKGLAIRTHRARLSTAGA
jgi:hypothetical protein